MQLCFVSNISLLIRSKFLIATQWLHNFNSIYKPSNTKYINDMHDICSKKCSDNIISITVLALFYNK